MAEYIRKKGIDMEERIYDFWAASLQDGYIGSLISIVEKAGGARSLFAMKRDSMEEKLGITSKLADIICENRDPKLIEEKYYKMQAKGICYVNHTDDDFPARLRVIPSPPYGLFVKGSLPDPSRKAVAIIGARECTEYGRLMAEYFGDRLAREGVDIISGMAWGIDGISQMAALSAGGRSYGVLGCGVDIIYPRKNRKLYEGLCGMGTKTPAGMCSGNIVSSACSVGGSGVISEYAPGSPAEARRFPPRNRIISGLCDVLLVVEARARSGTLITVDMAVEQGKTIMVIPGRITDDLSVGCLNLMKDGALPATSIGSVLDVLYGPALRVRSGGKKIRAKYPKGLTEDEKRIYDTLSLKPQSLESVAFGADLDITTVMMVLTDLEMSGDVKEISNGYFVQNPKY